MSPRTRWTSALALAWLLAAAPAPLSAQVRDPAHFFSEDTVRKADEVIRAIRSEHRETLLIDTIATVPDDMAAQVKKMSEEDRNRYFQKLAEGRAADSGISGVYVLICKAPGHVQVEVGDQTRKKAFTTANVRELNKILLSNFKNKKNDEGLLQGVRYVREAMDRNLGHATGKTNPPPTEKAPSGEPEKASPGWFASPWGWICIGLVGLVVLWVVIGLFRMASGAGRRPVEYGPGGAYGGPRTGAAPGAPGYPAGYPAPSGGSGGGFGGFLSGLAGGMLGGAAGSWMYDRFFRGGAGPTASPPVSPPVSSGGGPQPADPGGPDTSWSGTGGDFGNDTGGDAGAGGEPVGAGGDFGEDTGGGGDSGDAGGGGDFGDSGTSDTGEGDSGEGGDFGGDTGGDAGGGDFGGDSGGGDGDAGGDF
jgi:uncharacterized protein